MSNTIEDKISLFTKVISEKIEHEFKEKQKKLIEYNENRIKRIINEYEEEKGKTIEKITKDEQNRKQRIILKTKSDLRLQILRKRQEFMERMEKEIKKRIGSFTHTPEYAIFLKDSLKKVLACFSEDKFVYFQFSKEDMENSQKMILETIQSFREENTYKIDLDNNLLGGVLAKSEDGQLEVDYTIDTILEESNKLIGLVLFSYLSEEN